MMDFDRIKKTIANLKDTHSSTGKELSLSGIRYLDELVEAMRIVETPSLTYDELKKILGECHTVDDVRKWIDHELE